MPRKNKNINKNENNNRLIVIRPFTQENTLNLEPYLLTKTKFGVELEIKREIERENTSIC